MKQERKRPLSCGSANRHKKCQTTYPVYTEILFPFNGWAHLVKQTGPHEFWYVRRGVFENKKRGEQRLAWCDSFEAAKRHAETAHTRSMIGSGYYR